LLYQLSYASRYFASKKRLLTQKLLIKSAFVPLTGGTELRQQITSVKSKHTFRENCQYCLPLNDFSLEKDKYASRYFASKKRLFP
jgi:hypothetical protein